MILRKPRNAPRRTAIPRLAAPLTPLLALALAPLLACSGSPAPRPAAEATTPAAPPAASTPAAPSPAATASATPQAPRAQTARTSDPRAWTRLVPRPVLPPDRPLRVGFLVVDGVYGTELVAPFDVLHHVRFHVEEPAAPEVLVVSPDGRPVTTFEGLRIAADHSFADAPPLDLLVVPSAEGSMDEDLDDPALIDWVRRAGSAATWVMSLCDGAFVLARAGLLDGLAATTFPADYDRFAQLFPGVDLRVNVSFVHDGPALTSQGGARSFDVALYLVDHLYGEEVARGVGGGLLVSWPPDPEVPPRFVVVPRPETDPDAPPVLGDDGGR